MIRAALKRRQERRYTLRWEDHFCVEDGNGTRVLRGSKVRTDWPGAIGYVTNIDEGEAEPDGETGVMTATSHARVDVRWKRPLTNEVGQVWQEDDFHIRATGWMGEGPPVADELEVVRPLWTRILKRRKA